MRVLVRCDGGGSLGVGHVIRSLALAEAAVAAGHEVVVAGRFEGSFLQRQLGGAPVEVVARATSDPGADPAGPLLALIQHLRPDVLHVDAYELAGSLAGGPAKGSGVMGHLVLSNMEDGTFGRRPADVVVDPTFGAERSPRPDDGSTWLLRGSRYTPVRQRVVKARSRRQAADAARTVLVVMGGTDPVGLAPGAVALLARTGLALEVTVIAAGQNAQRARAAAEGSALLLTVLAPVNALAELMSVSDLVITAAGTTIWELCCLGVPAAVVWAVDNQREGYGRVVSAGAAIGLGGPGLGGDERAVGLLIRALTDSRMRDAMVLAGRRIVDGLGAWRVVTMWEAAQRQYGSGGSGGFWPVVDATALAVRPATLQDSRQLWAWRNDPVTRAGSRSTAEVPWDHHVRWLTDSLARADRMLLMVQDRDGPVGTVRWDLAPEPADPGEPAGPESHEWEVSITVEPQRRGQSLARPLLRAGEKALMESTRSDGTPVTAYLAVVHRDNPASVRLFETSGYVPDLPADSRGFMRYRKAPRVP